MFRRFWKQSNVVSKNLFAYDYLVNDLNCNLVWQCEKNNIVQNYVSNITGNHIEIGPGTGYFLQNEQFNTLQLIDINNDILVNSGQNLKKNSIEIQSHCHNIFSYTLTHLKPADSIGLSYVLHCVPGKIEDNVKNLINNIHFDKYILFGASVIKDPEERNMFAEIELFWLNKLGIFNNHGDTYKGLQKYLQESGFEYNLRLEGYVAIFHIRIDRTLQ